MARLGFVSFAAKANPFPPLTPCTAVNRTLGENHGEINEDVSSESGWKPARNTLHTHVLLQVFINVSLATNNAVDPSRRATLNGLSMTLGSVFKAAGPTLFSAIFAWSVGGHHRPFPLDHHLAFYLLALG